MGFHIIIGNATICKDDSPEGVRILTVESMKHNDAPNYGGIVEDGNLRMPSYSQWKYFCDRIGVDIFKTFDWGTDGDCNIINHTHADRIDSLLAAHKDRHPGLQANEDGTEDEIDRARLEWLAWWLRYAVNNCEYPSIYIS